ncbi:MAG: DMT family transporter [Treponema sp.]|jgi:drug/metabolite transporter (DMT)-like permease|nr:DMT family transporter [Treponema sp.]
MINPCGGRNFPGTGPGAIFLCALLWSTSGLCIKLIPWPPMAIAGGRSFLAVLLFLVIRALRPPAQPFDRRSVPACLAGGAAYAATMISFVIANKYSSPANVILLQYSAPVWAALLGWLLIKEKLRWKHWLALFMALGGLILFFKDGLADGLSGASFFGDSLALFSGLCFGANSVFMRMQKEGNPADSMFIAHILTALCSIPFFILQPPALNLPNGLGILYMGFIQIGAASLLFSYGIKRVSAVQSMLIAAIEPVLNPLWVLLVTGEIPSLAALAGGGVIIAAVLVSALPEKKPVSG